MLMEGDFDLKWPEGAERNNRIVFIVRNLDRESLEASFRSCLV